MTAYPKPPYLSVKEGLSPHERCHPHSDISPPSISSQKQASVNILPHHGISYSSQYLPVSPHLSSYPDYFHKGSVIQLASGHTKRVEDLVTEDFISSARSNPDITIDDSTLVKIDPGDVQGWAALTFRVGKESLQVLLINQNYILHVILGHCFCTRGTPILCLWFWLVLNLTLLDHDQVWSVLCQAVPGECMYFSC